MTDKYPALDNEIDADVAVNEDVGESDFLSREKELLGDEFQTEQDKEVLGAEEEDDDFSEFQEQFPEVDGTHQVAQEVSEEEDEVEAQTYASTASKLDGESPHIAEWRERRELEIEERAKANTLKKNDIIAKAQTSIDDFYDNYNSKKDEASAEVQKEQESFLEKRDGFLKRGTLWDRVGELISDVGEVPDDEDRDKTRLKGLLDKLKGKENVPGASGY